MEIVVVSKIDIPDKLTKGKIYNLEQGPITYNTEFEEVKTFICKTDQGQYIKVDTNWFMDIQKLREKKLSDLGIN